MTRSLFQNYHEKQAGKNGDDNRKQQTQLMEDITLAYLSQMEANSVFFAQEDVETGDTHSRLIPQFEPKEVQLETMVGMGEYGTVYKVDAIHLKDDHLDDDENSSGKKRALAPKSVVHNGANRASMEDRGIFHQDDHIGKSRRMLFPSSDDLPSLATHQRTQEALTQGGDPDDFSSLQINPMLSQSITVAKLASPTVPMEDRQEMMMAPSGVRRRSSVLSRDVLSMAGSPAERTLRRQLAKEADDPLHRGAASSRFALKQVRKDLYPKKKCEAAKDLAREAKFLALLCHPSIICLRGLVSLPGKPEFGILLDRLRITLSEESIRWKSRQDEIVASSRSALVSPIEALAANLAASWPFWQHSNKPYSPAVFGSQSSSSRSSSPRHSRTSSQTMFQNHQYGQEALWLMGERLLALYDVAQALEYLHARKIVFRDLKPENVAMLGTQRFQLFDFGLAKECKAVDRWPTDSNDFSEEADSMGHLQTNHAAGSTNSGFITPDDDGGKVDVDDFYTTYKMTGLTGTLRIMAPEAIQCLPYGLPVDVFSFGICMWESFTGDRCSFLSASEVCKGLRPDVPPFDGQSGVGLPRDLEGFLQLCWSGNPFDRPSFVQVCEELKSQLIDLLKTANRPSSTNDRVAVAAQSAFWERLESIQQPAVVDSRGTAEADAGSGANGVITLVQ